MRRARAIVAAAALSLALAGSAGAALPQQAGEVDLLSEANLRLDGAAADDIAGFSVAGAGDVNGDGRADLIIGAPNHEVNGDSLGSAYVIFGQANPANVDLASLGAAGIRIDGAAVGDLAGSSVAGAGDVNGDGRADLIIGAPDADNNGRSGSGSAYVIFGQASPTNVNLASLGTSGFRIDGAAAGDDSGSSVAGAGDVNGDGRADLIIGAPQASNNGRSESGSAYLVFGQASPTSIDLASLGAGGIRIDGAARSDNAGSSVAGAGDVNGDGRAELIIGAPGADNNGRGASGSAYLIRGQASPTIIDLASLGAAGSRIDGAAAGDNAGRSVAGTGDVSGDGRVDLIVGAPLADNNGRNLSGSAYLLFGQASPADIDLASLGGAGGIRIDGAAVGDQAGSSVAGAGDVNGDGRADLIVGAASASYSGRGQSGSAFVLFTGQLSLARVDLASLGATRGVRVGGGAVEDLAGASVAGVGDVNGDGRADVLIGAYAADNNARNASGSAYVVFGFGTPSLSYPPAALSVGQQASLSPTMARTGPPSFTVTPPLPAGLGLDPASGVISGTPSAAGTSQHTVQMTDLAGTASATFAITIAGQGAVTGLPVGALCATPAPISSSTAGTIALTVQQLAINQRIGQAAIRRLNAIEAWLNAGVVGGDICGGGLGAGEFAPAIVMAAGPAQSLAPPSPRGLQIAKAVPKKTVFTLTARQLLINQRIYQAALRRSRGLEARLGGALTGGDLRDAQVSGGQLALGLVISSAAPSPAPAASLTTVAPRSGGNPGAVTLSATQLAINQKIAQAGVRGANALRARLQTGLSGANFADGSLTAADLAPGMVP